MAILGLHQRVRITDGAPIAGLRRFEIRDPFGNRVEFVQRI